MISHIDKIPSGGLGLKIIGTIADELSYTRSCDDRNCLHIIKYFKPAAENSRQCVFFKKRESAALNSFKWVKNQQIREPYRNSHQPIQKISLRLNTEIEAVTQVLHWVEQLENLPIPAAVLQQCKIAAIEGFTNAVRHAHKTLPAATPIELAISVFNERLEIEIWDSGKPFDFPAKLQELQAISLSDSSVLEFML